MSVSNNTLGNLGSLKTSSLTTNAPVLGNKDNLLQPSWLGNIDWSRGISTLPNKYKANQVNQVNQANQANQANIIDYWGEYKSPNWYDIYDYRKSFSTSNYNCNSFNNYENIDKFKDNDNRFITVSKNKKTIK